MSMQRSRGILTLALLAVVELGCTPRPRGSAPAPAPAPASEPAGVLEVEPEAPPVPVLGLELGLPERPSFAIADVPALAEDGTWSIRGLRAHIDALLPEAEQGRVVLVSAYVQEVYTPPTCPAGQLCPPGKMPHAWLVDDPAIRGKVDALMLTDIEFPIPEWDREAQLAWADAPVPVLEPGRRYVFMGWFRRFTYSGFAHDRGLLELFAVSEAPPSQDSVWIAPLNSDHHPRVREARGLPPLPERAALPPGVAPGDPLPDPGPLVEPDDRAHAQELARAAQNSSQPIRADYYYRWLIVDDPDVDWSWVELANAYLDYGNSRAGIAVFDVALARMPESATLHTGRGRFFLNLGQPADAVPAYRRALELKPDAPDALFGLGMAYAEISERELATEALERFLVVAKDAPEHIIQAARNTIAQMQVVD
jgi:hypothetical protein